MPLEPSLTSSTRARLEQLREQIDAALQELVSDVLTVAAAEQDAAVSETRAATRREADAALQEALEKARAQSLADGRAAQRQRDFACMERLLDAIRDLDAATSLSQVLDKLADQAGAQITRVAVLVVRNGELRGWKTAGFGEGALDAWAISVRLDAPPVVGRAAHTGTRATTGDPTLQPLAFAPLPDDRIGLALPLRVGDRTVAVLYADEGAVGEPPVPGPWPECLEILARHAARCLELLTVARAYGVRGQQVSGMSTAAELEVSAINRAPQVAEPEVSPIGPEKSALEPPAEDRSPSPAIESAAVESPASASSGSESPRSQSPGSESAVNEAPAANAAQAERARHVSEEEDASAFRYARLLISEIKLYHEDAVHEGRRDGNLLERLGPEIARARSLYEEHVPAEVRSRTDHFGQELVRTLANGNPRLLGQAT